MLGRLAAARLLGEAHELLVRAGSPAVGVGWRRLRAELALPDGPEPMAGDEDRALARRAELAAVGAA